MTERGGAEAAHLHVVAQQRVRLAERMRGTAKEWPLMLEAVTPGEHAADVQAFALHLGKHVRGLHANGGGGVVRAAGGMNVMIAAVIAEVRRIDPALKPHRELRFLCRRNGHLSPQGAVFRAAGSLHREPARWQQHGAAIRAVDVFLEKEIRCEPPRLRREDVAS